MGVHALKQVFDEVQDSAMRAARHMHVGMPALMKNQSLRMKKIRSDFKKADNDARRIAADWNRRNAPKPKSDRSPEEQLRDIPLYKIGGTNRELPVQERVAEVMKRAYGTVGATSVDPLTGMMDPVMLKTVTRSMAQELGEKLIPDAALTLIYLEFQARGMTSGSGAGGGDMSFKEFKDLVMEDQK